MAFFQQLMRSLAVIIAGGGVAWLATTEALTWGLGMPIGAAAAAALLAVVFVFGYAVTNGF